MLHPRLLLLACTGAAIFRAGLVELPGEVEHEGAAGGVAGGDVAIAKEDGIGLVGVEKVDATQVGSQCAEAAQVEVFLHAKAAYDARLGDAEVVVFTLRGPVQIGTQPAVVRQIDGIAP